MPGHFDEPQHDPISPIPEDLSGKPIEDIIEAVREWFGQNFEDPSEETPREDGDFVYIWGGPYDTRDIIENVFADSLTEEEISAVVDDLNGDGIEWVPNSRRRQPPEEEGDNAPDLKPAKSAEQLHGEMLAIISSVEHQLNAISPHLDQQPLHSIGHNHPPEAIDDAPVTHADLSEIRAAIETLKSQPVQPSQEGRAAAGRAREALLSWGGKIGSWVATQADNFVTEAMKSAGKAVGPYGRWDCRLANLRRYTATSSSCRVGMVNDRQSPILAPVDENLPPPPRVRSNFASLRSAARRR